MPELIAEPVETAMVVAGAQLVLDIEVRDVGDLVMWDNRCTLHRGRRYDDAKYRRDLRRVTTQDMDSINDNPELVAAS